MYDISNLDDLLASSSPSSTSPTTDRPRTRSRVPITAAPRPVTPKKESPLMEKPAMPAPPVDEVKSVEKDDDDKVNTGKKVNNITARFISSSLTSTNIMDTSEAPIALTTTPKPTEATAATDIPTTPSTTSTSPTTTTVSTTSSETTTSDRVAYQPKFSPQGGMYDTHPTSEVLITTHVISDSEDEGPVRYCPPRMARTLEWPLTRFNQEVSMPCPMGTQGKARWRCSGKRDDGSVDWATPEPDLSDCRSLWLLKIHQQLKKKVSVVHLSKEMAHYTAFNELYGGDITSLIDAIGVMTEKMFYELPDIPTEQQKEAIVMEIVQSVIKTASIMLTPENQSGWRDLGEEKQKRTLTFFSRTLKSAGLLLPKAVRENQEITVSSPNIRKFPPQKRI